MRGIIERMLKEEEEEKRKKTKNEEIEWNYDFFMNAIDLYIRTAKWLEIPSVIPKNDEIN